VNYIGLLQEYQLKVTPQRLEIVNILDTRGHINIDDLYGELQKKFPTLSLATIYKNLNKMCENFFVSEVKIPHKKSVYELTKAQHSHVICSECNTIIDITINIDHMIGKVESETDYTIKNSSVIFEGVCSSCAGN
jgi:Fur family peroxide stress response transcriptional regulator